MPRLFLLFVAIVLAGGPGFAAGAVDTDGCPGGIAVVIGESPAETAAALADKGEFTVQCLCPTVASRDAARAALRARGAYGRVSAKLWTGGVLPYVDNLVNVVVVLAGASCDEAELLRVLVPGGRACRGAAADNVVTKPWPRDIDEWSHYLHGPDGNPVAEDHVVGPPAHFQWINDPMWQRSHESDSSVSTLVTSQGRLFYIVDEAPISLTGNHDLPDKWCLAARDAFNGVDLWKVPIRRWGWREWKPSWFNTRPGDVPLNVQKRLVATADRVYVTLGYQAPVTELDARTGEILKTYANTERTHEILLLDGTLYLEVVTDRGARVMAVDASSGKQLWRTQKHYAGSVTDYVRWKAMRGSTPAPKLDPALNIATDGRVVAFIDGADVVAVDAKNGAEKWRTAFPTVAADRQAGRIAAGDRLWVGTMIVKDGVVLHASPNNLAGMDAATGRIMWQQPKRYIGHLWYEWKDIFVVDGLVWTWSEQLERKQLKTKGRKQASLGPVAVCGYDLKTGERKENISLGDIFTTHHHHRCYRNKATPRYILASRRGTEFVDLVDGKHTVHNWVRGTCHVGMMPANGLQYCPPHPCQCYIDEKLNGFIALAGEQGRVRGRSASNGKAAAAGLEKGPAYGFQVSASRHSGISGDWPRFRCDSMRSGFVDTSVADGAKPSWSAKVGAKVSAPIAIKGRLFASLVDEHHVVCLDGKDGRRLWEFAAGSRVDSPPTYHRGLLLFGSSDGHVYCLRAQDGVLVWRFRAAPCERLMAAYGQLESAWPVHGSVLVVDEPSTGSGQAVAYVVAGRSSQLDGGLRLYGLDVVTGQQRCANVIEGPFYGVEGIEQNYELPMGALPDILVYDGESIHMRTSVFDKELKSKRAPRPTLQTGGGFLDDNYFKRVPWRVGGEYARMIAHDKRNVYYVRMFDSLEGLNPNVYFTPGAAGYLLFGKDLGGRGRKWSRRIPIRVCAMALTSNRVYVAGPPDVVDPKDPLGAFEARKGGLLQIVDTATGEEVAEHKLESPPVFNGIAAAAGRLYIVQEDGRVVCFR